MSLSRRLVLARIRDLRDELKLPWDVNFYALTKGHPETELAELERLKRQKDDREQRT